MNYKLINEALSDISSLRYNHKKFPKVSEKSENIGEYEGSYSETVEIYSLGEDDLHLKLTLRTDSYGDNESIHSVQVVKPIVKQVTDFEAI